MSPGRSIDERYAIKIANPLRATTACRTRAAEIAKELDAAKTGITLVVTLLDELANVARQLEAISTLLLQAHGAGDD